MTEQQQPNRGRPALHRWVIGVFGLVTFGFALTLIGALSERAKASLWDFPFLAACLWIGVVAFVTLLAGRHHKWAYYVTAACLAIWSLRAAETALLILADLMCFADWKLARDSISSGHLLLIVLCKLVLVAVSAFLVTLFIRFTFGTPSRNYFGLPPWRSRSP